MVPDCCSSRGAAYLKLNKPIVYSDLLRNPLLIILYKLNNIMTVLIFSARTGDLQLLRLQTL